MTEAKQRDYYKNAGETVSLQINCGPVLPQGETIDAVLIAEISQKDGEGMMIVGTDKLTFASLAPNTAAIKEPGLEAIPIGRGIVGLVSGGPAGVAQPIKITIPFTTSGGQRRDAEILLEIRF